MSKQEDKQIADLLKKLQNSYLKSPKEASDKKSKTDADDQALQDKLAAVLKNLTDAQKPNKKTASKASLPTVEEIDQPETETATES